MTELKQQNTRITPATSDWYGKNFVSTRQGIEQAITSFMLGMDNNPVSAMFADPITAHDFMMQTWRQMWRHTLVMLKGEFTRQELCLIINCHNSHIVTPMMYGSQCLLHNVSDSMALDGTAEKWEVDPDQIKAKLKGLPALQAFCLEIWATGFWYGKNQAKGFDDYIAVLL